jgi:hypothetical protein
VTPRTSHPAEAEQCRADIRSTCDEHSQSSTETRRLLDSPIGLGCSKQQLGFEQAHCNSNPRSFLTPLEGAIDPGCHKSADDDSSEDKESSSDGSRRDHG